VQAYRTPDAQFLGLVDWPYVPHYAVLGELRLHYVDEGAGDPILLLHGEPTWGYLYRSLVPPLAGVARVVVPDYLGFGRSDKPLRIEDYSYDLHYESIVRLVEELEPTRLTIVVQDWGGPIGLRLAVERPELVDRLVLLNTGVGAGRAPSPEWLRFRAFVRRLGTELVASRLIALSCVSPPDEAVLAAYDAPFPVPEAKTGMLAFPELVPTELDHPSAEAMLRVREGLRSWTKPALVLFSDSDPIFSGKPAERFAELIPGAGPAETVKDAGHFLQEDQGEVIAERIVRFLRD
jgi:haloalkane dehalogenase